MNPLRLKELANLIKMTIQSELFDEYWVTAEIAKISCHHTSGHCYIDLVEKKGDAIIARMRATIWARNYGQIRSRFQDSTGQDLMSGMKILMLTSIAYHEVHGLSLNVSDIDPSYTLGEMALKRRQIIERLIKENIIDLNKKIPMPPVMKNIAVISSPSAAGYGDFMSRLDTNPYGFRFSTKLFQAYVQGELAEQSIRTALRQCKRYKDTFDVVVIIRGGGSMVDLHCFDSYHLAKDIALFPLPVLTGIGHERDETVTDRVAHKRLITPTAVAEYIISGAKLFEERIDVLSQRLMTRTNTMLERGKESLKNLAERLQWQSIQYLRTSYGSLSERIYFLQTQTLSSLRTPSIDLKTYEERLKRSLPVLIKNSYQKLREFFRITILYPKHMLSMGLKTLEHLEMKVNLLDPGNVLKRGYSITYLRGKALRDTVTVKKNDIIVTRVYGGMITSIVECIKEKIDDEKQ